MIESAFFYDELMAYETDFFTGVPDSLLKSFCAYITDNAAEDRHSIAVNEGAALGLAAGYHLATGKTPLVYMQNSGLGNAVNPLLSLADAEVYGIPLVLLIGWRGQPGVHDEPQHIKQGKVTCAMLEAMGVPYEIMADNHAALSRQIAHCYDTIAQTDAPFAFVVQKDTFAPYTLQKKRADLSSFSREDAIAVLLRHSGENDVFVSTTGMASRELYELRENARESAAQKHNADFLTVGSMGHAASIALGIALAKPHARVTCLDGDGALLMHMGALASIAARRPPNLRYVVLNNAAHDSVGGQPTIAGNMNLSSIAAALGFERVRTADNAQMLADFLRQDALLDKPVTEFIEIRVKKGARADLGRPKTTPRQNKAAFMETVKKLETATELEIAP